MEERERESSIKLNRWRQLDRVGERRGREREGHKRGQRRTQTTDRGRERIIGRQLMEECR